MTFICNAPLRSPPLRLRFVFKFSFFLFPCHLRRRHLSTCGRPTRPLKCTILNCFVCVLGSSQARSFPQSTLALVAATPPLLPQVTNRFAVPRIPFAPVHSLYHPHTIADDGSDLSAPA